MDYLDMTLADKITVHREEIEYKEQVTKTLAKGFVATLSVFVGIIFFMSLFIMLLV